MHYLLSVVGDTANPVDDSEPGAVDAFNDQLQEDGNWVFAGGLDRPRARDRGRRPRRRARVHRRPVRRVQGVARLASGSSRPPTWTPRSKLAAEGSKACAGKVEVRPFDGASEPPDARRSTRSIARVYREEYGRVVASLARRFGDLDIAEDAAGEAFATAVEQWPADGVPPNPGGWLTTTAGNKAIDRLRREGTRDAKHQAGPDDHRRRTPRADRRRSTTTGCG